MSTKPVTDQDFETQVLKTQGPVLVDFWAEWCGPCRALGPKLEEISKEMAEKVTVVKMNVDENPSTPSKFGIRGIPTMILFKDGKEMDQIVGNQSKEDIVSIIKKHI